MQYWLQLNRVRGEKIANWRLNSIEHSLLSSLSKFTRGSVLEVYTQLTFLPPGPLCNWTVAHGISRCARFRSLCRRKSMANWTPRACLECALCEQVKGTRAAEKNRQRNNKLLLPNGGRPGWPACHSSSSPPSSSRMECFSLSLPFSFLSFLFLSLSHLITPLV